MRLSNVSVCVTLVVTYGLLLILCVLELSCFQVFFLLTSKHPPKNIPLTTILSIAIAKPKWNYSIWTTKRVNHVDIFVCDKILFSKLHTMLLPLPIHSIKCSNQIIYNILIWCQSSNNINHIIRLKAKCLLSRCHYISQQ